MLTCGAASGVECLQIFKSGKKLLRFCASGPYLNELIGYDNLMDCPEILPDDSLAIKHKNVWGICVFQNWSPAMAFVVTRVAVFLDIKLDRNFAKQPTAEPIE